MSLDINMWPVLLLVSLCGLVQGLYRVDPLVSTNKGLIRGLQSEEGYAQFLGIPYAVVDKKNPFGPSVPHPGFDDVFEAYETTMCPQVYNNVAFGTIDCLTLNIYVPSAATSQNLLPVMVSIHGGAFVLGSAETEGSPTFLLKHNVIVVRINYRLGAYGFMCLDIPEVPGNQGLKDQVLALRWINENIEAFGGDSGQITVFGESAGGMSVNLHLLSSYETLFQRAIIQSGPASSSGLLMDSDKTVPIQLAKALDFETENTLEALEYLAFVDVHTLVKLAHDLKITSLTETNFPSTVPCIEKKIEGIESFMTDYPMNIISPKVRNTPVIIGHASNEMPFLYGVADADFFSNYDFSFISNAFDLKDDWEEAVNYVKRFYIGDEQVNKNLETEITDFASDFIFNYPTQRMADRLLEIGAEKVYRYVFSYSGGRNWLKIVYNLNSTGAIHGDEIGYLFDHEIFSKDITPEDQLMIDRITTLWINFVKYGDPTPTTSELLPVKWQPITKTSQPYLNLDSDLTLEARPFHDRMAFWDLFYKLHKNQHKYEVSGK
ncbi:esterase FE4-like isoform X3 [Spodoptera frugiperda]|uniref:Carboxylic ester hydrolase n=1 Tax=Spodoptera frugiperda TaxID=7108 RepID=A0A9R0EVA8_SPOFR|nr:esterase FE4-like isoform X3 [Spodoptera frugiperda]